MGRNDSGLLELERLWYEYRNAHKVFRDVREKGYAEVDKRHEHLSRKSNEKYMVYREAKKAYLKSLEETA